MDAFLQDLRFAIRSLQRVPGLLITVVLTIALAIGSTTAVLTAVDRIVLRPLPFPDSERSVVFCETSQRTAGFCVASPANVADWARSVSVLESAGVARSESGLLERDGRPIAVPGGIASPGFFTALAVQVARGRLFEDPDLDPGRNHVLLVTHKFWIEHLGGREDAVGSFINLDGRAFRIVGVLAPDSYLATFEFVQFWKPLTTSIDDTSNRNWRGFLAVGRLVRDASLTELETQMAVVRARLASDYPEANATWGLRIVRLREHMVGAFGSTLWLFLAAAALVWIVACANVASILIARAAARGPEFAIRASLGAGWFRLGRQLLTESLILTAIGGSLGLGLGAVLTRVLVALAPPRIPRLDEVQMDAQIALIALGLSLVTALVFGLAPARGAVRRNVSARDLKGGRQTASGESRVHSVLVVMELTLAVMLLLSAAVLTRAFARLTSWEPGFDRTNVSVLSVSVQRANGSTMQSAVSRLEHVRDAVAAMPGMRAVGLGSSGPLASTGPIFGGLETGVVSVEGEPPVPEAQQPVAHWRDIDETYFTALGRPLIKGRGLTPSDAAGAPAVAIVNEAFATRIFGSRDAVGRRVAVQGHSAEIVGIVSNARPLRPDEAVQPEIFWPIRQYPRLGAYLVMKTSTNHTEREIKARLEAADPGVRAGTLATLDARFETELISPRFNMWLIGMFAAIAAVLALIGLYGLISYSVVRRTKEFGVRIALGATPGGLAIAVSRRVLLLAGIGMLAGLGLSVLSGRVLSTFAYGVPVTDPVVLAASLTAFTFVAIIAGLVPALRASRVDPILALRD